MTNREGIPLDGGWAWVISACVFLNYTLIVGFLRVISVLFVDVTQAFSQTTSVTSLSFSIHALTGCIASIVTSHLVMRRYTVRTISVIAAVINALATLALALAPNIVVFLLLFIVKGATFGCLLVCPISLIGYYFNRRKNLALAVCNIGYCVSMIAIPPVADLFRFHYGFRGCLLMMSAIDLHLIPVNMLLRSSQSYGIPHLFKNKNSTEGKETRLLPSHSHCHQGDTVTQEQANVCTDLHAAGRTEMPAYDPRGGISLAESFTSDSSTSMDGHPSFRENSGVSASEAHTETIPMLESKRDESSSSAQEKLTRRVLSSQATATTQSREVYKGDNHINSTEPSVPSNNAQSHPEKKRRTVKGLMYEEPSVPVQTSPSEPEGERTRCENAFKRSESIGAFCDSPRDSCPGADEAQGDNIGSGLQTSFDKGSLCSVPQVVSGRTCWIHKVFDLSLFEIWRFRMMSVFCPCTVIINFLYVFLPVIALDVGVSQEQAAWYLTICGGMDLVARLGVGLLADLHWLSKPKIIMLGFSLLAVFCHTCRFYLRQDTFVAYALVVGGFGGFRQNLMASMITDYVGRDRMAKGYAVCSTLILMFLSANYPVIGALFDLGGNYVIPVHYIGVWAVLSVVILAFEPFFAHKDKHNQALILSSYDLK